MTFPVNHKNPEFEIVYTRKLGETHVVMLGSDPSFLQQKWNMIAEWAKKIDPGLALAPFEIIEKKQKEFTHYICLNGILPRPVNVLYGAHEINEKAGNCHAAALIGAGFYSGMSRYLKRPQDFCVIDEFSERIQIQQVASGDLIFLDLVESHSFVFLDHDLSLTLNGVGQSLEIQGTESVLHRYGFPMDSLQGAGQMASQIKIWRKKPEWHYKEEILSAVTTFYELANRPSSYRYSGDLNYTQVRKIAELLYSYAIKTDASQIETKAYKALFSDVKSLMPGNMTQYLQV